MKIAIWGKSLKIKQKTGLEIYTSNIIKYLIKNGANNQYTILVDKNLKTGFCNNNCKVKVLKWPLRFLWTQIKVPFELSNNEYDVAFFPSFTVPLFSKVKKVVVIHDCFVFDFPSHYSWFDRMSFRFWIKISLKRAKILIVPSNYVKNKIVKYFPQSKNKIKVVYLGYEPVFRLASKSKIKIVKNKYKIKFDYFVHVVGGFVARKNTELVILAFKKFLEKYPQVRLVVIGREFGPEYNKIHNLVKDLDIESSIMFLSYISTKDVACLLSGSIASLYPSLSEGFGLPIIESMASGSPVITSNMGAMKEIAEDAAILVNPYKEQEIFAAMKKIYLNKRLHQQYKKIGVARARLFSWEKCAQETSALFEKLGAK